MGRWRDERLQWKPEDYAGISELDIPTNNIWTPDIVLYSDVREEERDLSHIYAKVYSNGDVSWLTPIIYRSYCKFDATLFPLRPTDLYPQVWFLELSRLGTGFGHMTESGDTTAYVDNGEWALIDIPVRRKVEYYSCCSEPFSDVTFYVIIKRRPLFYFFNIILPSICVASVTLLTFCLPPESGEKMSLSVTVLLALTVFLLLVAELMPPQADVIPLIGK
ncbi:LOW QUALITY PROTEIN: neuronal acetylcholine receptor subunit alpha-2-like [Lingula anatina]|uniref:LOW QUALITY PROTEIN: neuronal acetylcholine receptor subunit alpha-2-like n=1 Tax=Lingula anatina TaxID=7574 RepID=A0A1S3HR42_LINAN|nr:LOW QUALITY PROTEIN: neuronal acetylcholine receptor subunit alpha-2-like [Lingula anatina]|eukprot:XP_013388505.1 LOW QUALITY PROTEIN: neuronal acetylcholine receptor subunit alpha-2-like [Lingula anatina]